MLTHCIYCGGTIRVRTKAEAQKRDFCDSECEKEFFTPVSKEEIEKLLRIKNEHLMSG